MPFDTAGNWVPDSNWNFNIRPMTGEQFMGTQGVDAANNFGLMDYGKFALGGLQTIGDLWSSYNQNKLAKQQMNFTRNYANINLANQAQNYNTALSDTARTRGFVEGQSQSQIDDYYNKNKMTTRSI